MTSHESNQHDPESQSNPSNHAEIVDEVQFSSDREKPPVRPAPTGGQSPTPSGDNPPATTAPGTGAPGTRRRRLRLRSNSTMGLIIVALGTLLGVLMRFVLPEETYKEPGLPAIKTPAENVKTPDLEKVKP